VACKRFILIQVRKKCYETKMLIGILVAIACSIICAVTASSKGRSSGLWFMVGFCLPVIGVILILALPDESVNPLLLHTSTEPDVFSPVDELTKLAKLRDAGVVTEAEYLDKKRRLMARIG
jgi:hypothetical protein